MNTTGMTARLLTQTEVKMRVHAYREAAAILERAMNRPPTSTQRQLGQAVVEFIKVNIVGQLRERGDLLAGGNVGPKAAGRRGPKGRARR